MKNNDNHQKKRHSQLAWSFVVFALSFLLSIAFGVASEFAMQSASVFVCVVIILIFMAIAIVSDMVGVAIAAVQAKPFHAMASRKVRGAKQSLKLIKHASKVASIASDVVGDVCGILSGAAGASISILIDAGSAVANVFVGAIFSALVASLTIFGKSIFKKYAIDNSVSIILILGKTISMFSKDKSKKAKNAHASKSENVCAPNTASKSTQTADSAKKIGSLQITDGTNNKNEQISQGANNNAQADGTNCDN